MSTILRLLILQCRSSLAANLPVEEIHLPPLQIGGMVAKAHTQGMEVIAGKFYVTARRDDVLPKRALLLRTEPTGKEWQIWDITPRDAQGVVTPLDHPGGFQSDGSRLWIPLAESKRNGRSVIRAFRLADLAVGQPLEADLEFLVHDHIGAVAASIGQKLLFGASWDTEKVHVWNLEGRWQRTLTGPDLKARGLGVVAGLDGRSGVTVQDWKFVGDRLYAAGLFRRPGSTAMSPESQLIGFDGFLGVDFRHVTFTLPPREGIELANEAMAISDGIVHFLPEDLGATNRIFRVSLADLSQ